MVVSRRSGVPPDVTVRGKGHLRYVIFAVFAIFYLIGVPLLLQGHSYVLSTLASASVISVISLGVWLTFAIGRINIGQGAFCLLGGYACALAITELGLSFWLAMPLAGLVCAVIGIPLGWAMLRLKGVYFAMITLSLTEAARLLMLTAVPVTGGATGIINIPVPQEISLFGLVLVPDFSTINRHVGMYVVAAVLLLLSLIAMWRIANSRLGRVFRALQQGEDLARSIGINVTKHRIMAYAICCFLGGIGGAYFTVAQQSIYPGSFSIHASVYFMLYCFLGGLAYVFGPVVGGFVLFLGFELLHELQQYQMLFYSGLMIALMLWLPNGLLSLPLAERYLGARAQMAGLTGPDTDPQR